MRVITFTSESELDIALNFYILPATWVVVSKGGFFTLIGISGDFIAP